MIYAIKVGYYEIILCRGEPYKYTNNVTINYYEHPGYEKSFEN